MSGGAGGVWTSGPVGARLPGAGVRICAGTWKPEFAAVTATLLTDPTALSVPLFSSLVPVLEEHPYLP